MAKSYRYVEHAAHVGALHTARISRKSSSVLATGGADGKVCVWAVSQPTTPLVVRAIRRVGRASCGVNQTTYGGMHK